MEIIDDVFTTFNYPEKEEYLKCKNKIIELNEAFPELFTDELYFGDDGRQMLLNDILEYIFSARGYYYMWNDYEKQKIYIRIVLHFINQLMILESISVNHELRNQVFETLRERLEDNNFFFNDESKKAFEALLQFKGDVHFDTADTNIVPDEILKKYNFTQKTALSRFNKYTDSVLPKLPHGLWRELIVYIQLLRINAGYILPLLLIQRIVSKNSFLKPPDFLVIREDGGLVGVEVGGGKETQTSNFSIKMKCEMVTAIDTRIPPRCPICGKWIPFCDKVINDYSNLDNPLLNIEEDIRCAHDCERYSYEEVLNGVCPYIKYNGEIDEEKTKSKQIIKFSSAYHYHYNCILKSNDSVAKGIIEKQRKRWEKHLASRSNDLNQTSRRMTINCLKTNYPHFDGLKNLIDKSKGNLSCYSKYLKNRNCEFCNYDDDCKKLNELGIILDMKDLERKEEIMKKVDSLFKEKS